MLKASTAAARQADGHKRHLQYIPGVLVIKWKTDVVPPTVARAGARSIARALPEKVPDRLEYLSKNFGLRRVTNLAAAGPTRGKAPAGRGIARHTEAVAESLTVGRGPLRGLTVVELDHKAKTHEAAKAVEKGSNGTVEYAVPAPARWALVNGPTDPRYNSQWGLPAIDWFGAKRPKATKVRVAILDTGVDQTHPDLKTVIAAYEHGSFSASDLVGHGTHVAGIIAAKSNNKIGIAGVANCQVMCWKVFSDKPESDGEIYLDNIAYYRALAAVSETPSIRVVNLSIGGDVKDPTEIDLIERLVKADRILIVAAMGNEYNEGNAKSYPAAVAGVLAVGAMSQKRRRAFFSNTGRHIGLLAPGTSILSTLPMKAAPPFRDDTEYEAWDGTSMATPFVAGAAALVFARHPGFGAQDVKERLLKGTTHLPGMGSSNLTSAYGTGLLNLPKAL